MRVVAGNESLPPAEQAQLRIGIEASMLYPATQKKILSRQPIATRRISATDCGANFPGQARTHLLVSIEQKHPIFAAQIDRILLLRHVSAPRLDDNSGAVFARDLA